MSKWTTWYDSLPESTKAYLGTQKQLWTDRDLAVVSLVGFFVGFVLGYIWR